MASNDQPDYGLSVTSSFKPEEYVAKKAEGFDPWGYVQAKYQAAKDYVANDPELSTYMAIAKTTAPAVKAVGNAAMGAFKLSSPMAYAVSEAGNPKPEGDMLSQITHVPGGLAAGPLVGKLGAAGPELLSAEQLAAKGVKPSMAHLSEDAAASLGVPWKETHFNYRLDPQVEDTKFLTKGGKVIGHVGLTGDNQIHTVFIDPKYQGKGFGTELYRQLFKEGQPIKSDELAAMEPATKAIWEKMSKEFPGQVSKTRDGYAFAPAKATSSKILAGGAAAAATAATTDAILDPNKPKTQE